jgi:hypothetical protein
MPLTSHSLKPFIPGIVITILLIAVTNNSFCQKIDSIYNNVDNKFYITLSPIALIDVMDHPSIRISGDSKIYKNISLSVENIFFLPLGDWFYKKDVRGFAIKPCVKFYLNNNKIINGPYIGLEYQYKQLYYNLTDSIKVNGIDPFRKQYGMTRYVNCINIKFGELTNHNGRIDEWFFGIGIRFFHSFTELPQEEHDGIIYKEALSNTSTAGKTARTIGNRIHPNITIGYKIGFKLY